MEQPCIDQQVVVGSLSRKICKTCHWFRHHSGVNCIPLLTPASCIRVGQTTWPAMAAGNRPPLSPQEGWLSDGRQVLHFRPIRWSRHNQVLEVTSGELLPGEPVPLLKRRRELTRDEAIRLWHQKRREGSQPCDPQW